MRSISSILSQTLFTGRKEQFQRSIDCGYLKNVPLPFPCPFSLRPSLSELVETLFNAHLTKSNNSSEGHFVNDVTQEKGFETWKEIWNGNGEEVIVE